MSRARDLNYGKGSHAIDAEALGFLDPQKIVSELRELFRSPSYEPPLLPHAALRVVELSRSPHVNIRDIVALLENEQLLTAKVLQLAGSVLYSRGQPLRSLDEAIARLGLVRTADLFLQCAMNSKVFRAAGYQEPMDRLRRHSTATAHIARHVCRHTAVFDEYAFLCGLLHDVGAAAAIIALADARRKAKVPDFSLAWSAVRQVHEECAAILGKLWHFPDEVCLVLRYHHDFVIQNYPHPLAAVVCVADWLASEAGAAMEYEADPLQAERARGVLGISDATLAQLRLTTAEVVKQVE